MSSLNPTQMLEYHMLLLNCVNTEETTQTLENSSDSILHHFKNFTTV